MYKRKDTPKGRPRTWSDEQLINAVKESINLSEVKDKLGFHINPKYFNKHVERLNLDTTHFIKGKWRDTKNHSGESRKIPLKTLLTSNSTCTNTPMIKRKLFEVGMLKNMCYECGQIPMWNNRPLTLQLHHIDGNRKNNMINNLTILCPNCHTQTKNYGRKSIKKICSNT